MLVIVYQPRLPETNKKVIQIFKNRIFEQYIYSKELG